MNRELGGRFTSPRSGNFSRRSLDAVDSPASFMDLSASVSAPLKCAGDDKMRRLPGLLIASVRFYENF